MTAVRMSGSFCKHAWDQDYCAWIMSRALLLSTMEVRWGHFILTTKFFKETLHKWTLFTPKNFFRICENGLFICNFFNQNFWLIRMNYPLPASLVLWMGDILVFIDILFIVYLFCVEQYAQHLSPKAVYFRIPFLSLNP